MTMRIVEPDIVRCPVDSFTVEFTNTHKEEGLTGEWLRIENYRPPESGKNSLLTGNTKTPTEKSL